MQLRRELGLRTRRHVYGSLLAVVAVALLAGLTLPFALGERPDDGPVSVLGDEALDVTGVLGAGDGAGPDGAGGEATGGAAAAGGPGEATAADGGTEGAGGPAAGGPAAAGPVEGPTGPLTASDVGVTASSIVLGVMVPDLGVFADLQDVPTAGEVEAHWRNLADRVNADGGVLGRKLDIRFARFNAVEGGDAVTAACTSLTQGQSAFAVLNSGGLYNALCAAQQHATPILMAIGQPDAFHAQNPGRIWTLFPRASRQMRMWVQGLQQADMLEGHRIGVLHDTYPEVVIATRDYLVPLLEQAGADLASVAQVSHDAGTAQTQIPVAVQRMQAAGVDTVLLSSNPLTASQFVQHSLSAGFRPQWVVSDWEMLAIDAAGRQMGAGFDGAIGFTTTRSGEAPAGMPEPEYDRGCRQRTGITGATGSPAYLFAAAACTLLDQLVAAMARVGPDLTRERLGVALGQAGSFPIAWQAGGSWSGAKPDAGDGLRRVRYAQACGCYRPIDPEFAPIR